MFQKGQMPVDLPGGGGDMGCFRIDRYITSFCSLLSYRADSHFLLSTTSC